jgi:hypothetical protein
VFKRSRNSSVSTVPSVRRRNRLQLPDGERNKSLARSIQASSSTYITIYILCTRRFNYGKKNRDIELTTDVYVGPRQRLATCWMIRGSNPSGGEIFRNFPDRSWRPPSLLCNEYGVFPGCKVAGGGADHPPHLAPKLRKE